MQVKGLAGFTIVAAFESQVQWILIKVLMNQPEHKWNLVGPIVALDLGRKRVGVAASDSMLISITKLAPMRRSNWKRLLRDVTELVLHLDAKILVIGLPLSLDGGRGSAALEAEYTAGKFARSLKIPVYLQDERLTSVEAEEHLRAAGTTNPEMRDLVDCQAAAIILWDFIAAGQPRILVPIP
ncbi:MAG: Holliday junction resolvase RuvX [Acidobacteriota bacterium]|nr:Holliday junction resolvase RuvX [Acidobacteriota bacterium]